MAAALRLCQGSLEAIGAGTVAVPGYNREGLGEKPAIVHLGVGGFHRSHMALYTCDVLGLDGGGDGGDVSWGICGVGVMAGDAKMRDALQSQDTLYTVLSRGRDSTEARVCGAIVKYLLAPDDPAAVLAQMEAP